MTPMPYSWGGYAPHHFKTRRYPTWLPSSIMIGVQVDGLIDLFLWWFTSTEMWTGSSWSPPWNTHLIAQIFCIGVIAQMGAFKQTTVKLHRIFRLWDSTTIPNCLLLSLFHAKAWLLAVEKSLSHVLKLRKSSEVESFGLMVISQH